jgi:hypothetical protein
MDWDGHDMAKADTDSSANRTIELLQRLLVMQMHAMGATQDQIAKTVGRQKLWVNGLLKQIPRRMES